jgi:hypothetical protein
MLSVSSPGAIFVPHSSFLDHGVVLDHGIKMKYFLLVSRIICPLLNKANHVKVEAHMAPPLPLTSLSIDPQNPIYKI